MNGIQTVDLNNVVDCIKLVQGIGQNAYYNICNESAYVVPWGQMDWVFFIFGTVVIVAIGILLYNIYTEVFK